MLSARVLIRYSRRGGTIKITVWLVTRERATYIAAAEILGLAVVLLTAPGPAIRFLVGLPLLAHVGYTALTSLPLGLVPGRPANAKQERRNQHLRDRVVVFLQEVRRVEELARRARIESRPSGEVEATLRMAQSRMMTAARQVAEETGRAALDLDDLPADRPWRRDAPLRDAHGVQVLDVDGSRTRGGVSPGPLN